MIDSHSHIYTKPYQSDRVEVIERAKKAGITQLLQVGCNLADSILALNLAHETRGIYASVGVHPHDADTWNEEVETKMRELLEDPKVIAYGEIGLDYYYDNSPREIQRRAFEQQLDFALHHPRSLPIVIHTREAEPDTLEILGKNAIESGVHIHCYTGTIETAEKLLEMDFYLGFTGVITFKSAEELRKVVEITPMDHLLIETDSPYLTPMPFRGKRNEPARVYHVAEKIAEVKQIPLNEVIQITSDNFKNLYGTPGFCWEELQDIS